MTKARSPFPGMDPYLERHWRDVHTRLTAYVSDALQDRLPGDLVARMEERVYVETAEGTTRVIVPDVKIVEASPRRDAGPSTVGGIAVVDPVVLELDTEPVSEPYVVIIEVDGGRVVTAIEFLSPANKIDGAGRRAYLSKRDELLASAANFVEVDLVREGDWTGLMRPFRVPLEYQTAYRIAVHRAARRGQTELYPISLRQPLPAIRIPLRPDDQDVPLDLQAVIEQVWRNGRYDLTDYGKPCDPPLTGGDAAWAEELLRSHKP